MATLTQAPENSTATLYVVATPIGNLEDLTPRAARILREVAVVAAEDTRRTATLLRHVGSGASMLVADEHHEQRAAQKIAAHLAAGQSVALVSDAGTPAISDPGGRVVAALRAEGWPVVAVPGACAAAAALSIAGLTHVGGGWIFAGFLPTKTQERLRVLADWKSRASDDLALVFYEAPHRIDETLAALAEAFGAEREILIGRELTKVFEQSVRLPLGEAVAWLEADANRARGEFVLVIFPPAEQKVVAAGLDDAAEKTVQTLVAAGLPTKQVAQIAQQLTGAPKDLLYQRALELKA
ncbi:MAG: 16S rRNA (cytidine(1402)-2'-O)-methyltransferase [Fluviibacter sp.]